MQEVERRRPDGGVHTLAQINRHARHGRRDCTTPDLPMMAMDMTAKQSDNLWMAGDQYRQLFRLLRMPVSAYIVRNDIKGWMVHEQDRGPVGFTAQRFVQPSESTVTEHAFPFALDNRIERNQARGKLVDYIMKEFSCPGQTGQAIERVAQRTMPVAIAGNNQERHIQIVQNLAKVRILLRLPPVDTVASMEDDIDSLPVDIGDALPQVLRTIYPCRPCR